MKVVIEIEVGNLHSLIKEAVEGSGEEIQVIADSINVSRQTISYLCNNRSRSVKFSILKGLIDRLDIKGMREQFVPGIAEFIESLNPAQSDEEINA